MWNQRRHAETVHMKILYPDKACEETVHKETENVETVNSCVSRSFGNSLLGRSKFMFTALHKETVQVA